MPQPWKIKDIHLNHLVPLGALWLALNVAYTDADSICDTYSEEMSITVIKIILISL